MDEVLKNVQLPKGNASVLYKGVAKGNMIALEELLPYPEGQPRSVSVEPWGGQPYPGSPAAIRQVMHEPPHRTWDEVEALERAMVAGTLPVHHAGVCDERRERRTCLVDTHACSDLRREPPKRDAHLASASSAERVMICPVVRGEICSGIAPLPQGRRRQELAAKATRRCAMLLCEPVPEAAGDYDAMVKLTRQQQGLALDEHDLWSAATALA